MGGASGKSAPSTSFMRNTPPSNGVPAARRAPWSDPGRAAVSTGCAGEQGACARREQQAHLGRHIPPARLRCYPRSRSPARPSEQAGAEIQNPVLTAGLGLPSRPARTRMPSSGRCCSSRSSFASLFITAGLRPSDAWAPGNASVRTRGPAALYGQFICRVEL